MEVLSRVKDASQTPQMDRLAGTLTSELPMTNPRTVLTTQQNPPDADSSTSKPWNNSFQLIYAAHATADVIVTPMKLRLAAVSALNPQSRKFATFPPARTMSALVMNGGS